MFFYHRIRASDERRDDRLGRLHRPLPLRSHRSGSLGGEEETAAGRSGCGAEYLLQGTFVQQGRSRREGKGRRRRKGRSVSRINNYKLIFL